MRRWSRPGFHAHDAYGSVDQKVLEEVTPPIWASRAASEHDEHNGDPCKRRSRLGRPPLLFVKPPFSIPNTEVLERRDRGLAGRRRGRLYRHENPYPPFQESPPPVLASPGKTSKVCSEPTPVVPCCRGLPGPVTRIPIGTRHPKSLTLSPGSLFSFLHNPSQPSVTPV